MRRVRYYNMKQLPYELRNKIESLHVVGENDTEQEALRDKKDDFVREDLGEAWFHCWGSSIEYGTEFNGGESVAAYTTAILETDEGKVIEHHPEYIEFITAPIGDENITIDNPFSKEIIEVCNNILNNRSGES